MENELHYVDANVQLGPAQHRSAEVRWRTAEVRRELSRCGIGTALCHMPLGAVDDPAVANRALLAEIAGVPGLLPAGVITPGLLDQIPPAAEQWARLDEAGVRAVIAWPKTHRLGLVPRFWENWAGVLEKRPVPLLVDAAELPLATDFESVQAWIRLFAPAPVVLLNASWGASNLVLRLLEACPNLHIEMSAWQAHDCPEFLVRHFGSERVLFGSGQPGKSPGAARAAVDYADLPRAQRSAIAGGNLLRLLGLDSAESAAVEEPADPLARAARLGQALPALAADAHAHVMAADQHMVLGICFPNCSPDRQMAINRRLGIRIQCQASWTGPVSAAARIGNDILLAAQKRFPEVVVPMVTVDPSQMTPAEIQAEIERLFERGPAAGLKPYHTMGIPYDDPAWAAFFEYGNLRRLFVLLHPFGGGAWAPDSAQARGFVNIARTYPDLSVLIAHSGSSFAYARTAVWVAERAPNVYLELTLTAVTSGVVEWLVETVGSERVLFGSDAPMRDPRQQLGWVVHADIAEADKRNILGLNFCRILARGRNLDCPAARRAREWLAQYESLPGEASGGGVRERGKSARRTRPDAGTRLRRSP